MKHLIAVMVAAFLALLIGVMTMREAETPSPDEPPLPTAPLPLYERVEPIPPPELPKPIEPKKLPPGVQCMEDCPLIDPAVVEEKVRAYYADVPVLVEIARCESEFRHYDEQGNVLRNRQGSSATGVMQIMASVHESEAKKLGLSIRDFDGNLAYARHLYEENGTQPWEASAYCWQSTKVATVAINIPFSVI